MEPTIRFDLNQSDPNPLDPNQREPRRSGAPGRRWRRARRALCGLAVLLVCGLSPVLIAASAHAAPPVGRDGAREERPTVDGRAPSKPSAASPRAAGPKVGFPQEVDCRDAGKRRVCIECGGGPIGCCLEVDRCTIIEPPKDPTIGGTRQKLGGRGASPQAPKFPDSRPSVPGRVELPTGGLGAGGGLRAPDPVVEPALPEINSPAKIWIDGGPGPLAIVEDRRPPHELHWDVSSNASANGVAILVAPSQLVDPCNPAQDLEALVAQGLPGSAFYSGTTGRTVIDFGTGVAGQGLEIVACGFDATQGRKVNLGQAGNRIQGQWEALGDLVVEDVRVNGTDVEFTLAAGTRPVPAGTLTVMVQRTNQEYTSRSKTLTHYATVELPPLPGRGSADFTVDDVRFDMSGPGTIRVCVNQWQQMPEQDSTNNCRELETGEVLPDLVARGELELKKREGGGGFGVGDLADSGINYLLGGSALSAVATVLGETCHVDAELFLGLGIRTPACRFGGPASRCFFDECVSVSVANVGGRTSAPAKVQVRILNGGEPLGGFITVDIPALSPGRVAAFDYVLNKRDADGKTLRDLLGDGCCTGEIIVDPGGQLAETDESNNRRALDVIEPGAARPGVRDRR